METYYLCGDSCSAMRNNESPFSHCVWGKGYPFWLSWAAVSANPTLVTESLVRASSGAHCLQTSC